MKVDGWSSRGCAVHRCWSPCCCDTLFVMVCWEGAREQGCSVFLELSAHVAFLLSEMLFSLSESSSVKWVGSSCLT